MSAIKTAFLWSGGGKIVQYFIGFVSGIIMARILFPKDYGLVGLLTIFSALSTLLIDSGYRDALIRNSGKNTEEDFSAVFYFNLSISIILYLTLFLFAPLIARFYSEPKLVLIARVSFLSIIFYSLSIVQTSKFLISIDFKSLTKINFFSQVISASTGIIMAVCGYGVWSLIISSLIHALSRLLFLWINLRWMPSLTKNFSTIKTNFSFSVKLLASRISESLSSNLIQLVIGKLYTISDVGFYTKALSLEGIPNDIITTTIHEVSYPVLARSNNEERLIVFKRMIRSASMISFPIAIGLIITAKPVILLLLTDKWAKSIPIMQVLSLLISVMPLNYLNNAMLKLHSKAGFLLWTSVLKNGLIISLLLILRGQGIIILCLVYVGVNVLIYLMYALNSSKVTGYKVLTQLKDVGPFFMTSIFMGCSMYLCKLFIDESMLLLLLSQCALGATIVLTLYFLLFRKEFIELLRLFKH